MPDSDHLLQPATIPAPSSSSPQSPNAIPNLSGKQLSQSYNSGTNGKPNLNTGNPLSNSSTSPLNKTSR